MALPEELLDELLSAHLDDALSGDELRRVEQMLRDDPSINARMEQLKRQRKDLFDAAFTVPKLPEGFADQVVEAAIERAERENLGDDHPLRLAAKDRPEVQPVSPGWTTTRTVGVIATLAASLLLAAFLVNKSGDDSLDPNTDPLLVGVEPESPVDPAEIDVPEPAPSDLQDATMLADNGTPVITPVPEDVNNDSADGRPSDSDTSTDPAMVATADPPAELAPAVDPLNMLLVIDVKRSESGRDTGSFAAALAKVQIEVGDEREVDENLARAVAGREQFESLDGQVEQVLLLESPAKKLDLLVNSLTTDRDGIEGIGFSAITAQFDAPLLRSIESVRTVDPTKIRHQGHSIPIVSQSGEVFQQWSNQLGDRDFAPLRSGEDAEMIRMMMSTEENGPDQMASILFLVR